MKCLKLGITLVIVLSVVKAAPIAKDGEEVNAYPPKLPRTSIPSRYELTITSKVNSGQTKFDGVVKIYIKMTENAKAITMNSKGLKIDKVKLTDSGRIELVNSVTFEVEKDFIIINSDSRELEKDELLTLEIAYTGELQTNMLGFYQSSYIASDGKKRYLAATQFEGTYARMAFICYDEPEYKATFLLIMKTDESMTATSNTDGNRRSDGRGGVTTIFKNTPKMSTYLLAFVISDFKVISNEATRESTSDTIHRVIARSDAIDSTKLALENSILFLNELERYAMTKYELPKMDHAAIPDFAFGAMENWGLIIYKETNLIGDLNSHHFDYLRILQVVAHELGHQFFGNLVTLRWWDYTWLNEGFATLFEYLLVENVYDNYRIRDFFNVVKVHTAMVVDSVESTHALTWNGPTIGQIVYDKAGSVIRMFQNAVGDEVFREGLKKYLKDNNHGAVTSADLYAAFESVIADAESDDFAFTAAFKSWEETKGFPMIHVSLDDDNQQFTIRQERYYAASETRVENDNRRWYIPLNLASATDSDFEDTTFTHYFENDQGATKNFAYPAGFDSSQWFVFNKQQFGFYRVNYDSNNWQQLIKILNSNKFKQIHVLNRAQLIDDSLNLAADGYLGYDVAFGVLSYLSRETDYIPWRAAVTNLNKIDKLLKGNELQKSYRQFIRYLNKRMFAVYGTDDKSDEIHVEKFARELSFDWACRVEVENCLTKSIKEVQGMVSDGKTVSASLEISYICNGLKGEGKSLEFQHFFDRMQSSSDQAERQRLIDGLICSSDEALIYGLLEGTLTSNTVTNYRMHERQRIFNNVFVKSTAGITAAADFIAYYWDGVVETYSQPSVEGAIQSMAKQTTTEEEKVKLMELLDILGDKLTQSSQEIILKNIDDNFIWLKSEKFTTISTFINDFVSMLNDVENQFRLPKTSFPEHYRLHIDASDVQKGEKAFSGEVEIDARVTQQTDHIMIHSRSQEIVELKVLNRADNNEIPIIDFHLFAPMDTLTIYFFENVMPDTDITIHIKYLATMLTYEAGFYQTFYDIGGERKYLGATQFQATDARFAFPCYDEPALKSVFQLKITHTKAYGAISNTIGTREESGDDTATTTFKATQPISTYLVAFVVSDLESIQNDPAEGETLHRVWVRPDSLNKAQYALEHSVDVLKALESYVGFKYELGKIDSVGVPRKGGAMENWGIPLYRESAMIYEENYDDILHSTKLSGVDVISHELAHQFFGDSVTCEWWDYIWLNEGFATLFEYHLMGLLHPNWKTRDFFNIRKLHNAFRGDSKETARAMTTPLLTNAEIYGAFDYVVYDKSGSVLRMFQNAVGENIFRAALKLYLETNDHSGVTSQDLIDAFFTVIRDQRFVAFDFEKAFRSWELLAGYPVIHVSLTESRQFNITQERFLTQKTNQEPSTFYIPLNFATASDPNFEDTKITSYFVNDQTSWTISVSEQLEDNDWFVFNKQQLGYYRVNYDFANWHALILALNSDDYDKIHVLNRGQLLDDALTFAAGDYLDYDTAFGLLSYLERETEYTPWYTADRFFSQLYATFGPKNVDLNDFVKKLTDKLYDTFKVPADDKIPVEDVYETYNRELAFKLACNAGNEQCLIESYKQVQLYLDVEENHRIPKGLQSVIFCDGFRGTGKGRDWTYMFMKLLSSTDATFRLQAINGLGCSDAISDLKDYLETTLETGDMEVFKQDEKRAVFNSVLSSHSGFEVAVDFIKSHSSDILKLFGYESLEDLLTIPVQIIKTQEQADMYKSFLQTQRNLDFEALARILKKIDDNMNAQNTKGNIEIMSIIRKLLGRQTEDTTTESTTVSTTTTGTQTSTSTLTSSTSTSTTTTSPPTSTSTSTTTASTTTTSPPTSTSTSKATTSTTTTAPLTSTLTSTSITTTTTTNAPTNPETTTANPTTTDPSTSPLPATDPTSTTTLGASTIGIKIATMLACLFVALSLTA